MPNRTVTEEEGRKLADEYNIPFFEVSAKTNQNINESFNSLVLEILKNNSGKEKLKANYKNIDKNKLKNNKEEKKESKEENKILSEKMNDNKSFNYKIYKFINY